jgi:hypothetical protein
MIFRGFTFALSPTPEQAETPVVEPAVKQAVKRELPLVEIPVL